MSSEIHKQTSSEVEHEAEDVRAGLAHTLDQLRDNLKPEHVIVEVVSNAKVGANSLVEGLYALARENPIPALLIGAGCAMVLGVGSGAGLRRRPRLEVLTSGARTDRLGAAPASPVRTLPEPESSSVLWSPPRKVTAGPRFRRAALDSSLTTVKDTMDRSMGTMRRPSSKGMSDLSGAMREQPLIIAALGVAVGAAIGAALPSTDVEDEWMGGTSSSVRQAAQEAAQGEIDELKSVAARTAENLKHSAADHGLSSDNLKGLVRDAGEHARTAMRDVGAASGDTKPAEPR